MSTASAAMCLAGLWESATRYIEFVQQNGTPAMYHNCGEIMNLVESYRDLGARIVEPFSPPPLGDADLARAKELVDGAYIIVGGVDQVHVLQKGTVDQVRQATQKTIEVGKPGGKFILQSADFLEYGTPLENLEAYVEPAVGTRFGRMCDQGTDEFYPLYRSVHARWTERQLGQEASEDARAGDVAAVQQSVTSVPSVCACEK